MWAIKDEATGELWHSPGKSTTAAPSEVLVWQEQPPWFANLYKENKPVEVEPDSEGGYAEVDL